VVAGAVALVKQKNPALTPAQLKSAVVNTATQDVTDESGPDGGRFRLRAAPDGTATCVPATEEADLSLSIADLATLWLGDESAVRLAALGRVRERQEGAAALADALLRTSRRPWCPDIF